MNALIRPLLRHWLAVAALVSAAMLAIAHAFQSFGGLAPCTLCLQQRQVYWDALAVAVAGLALSAVAGLGARLRGPILALLALIFLVGAGIAAYHAGAEWKWWPGPQTCSGGGGASSAALARLMHGARIVAPRCDEAAWRMLGLSMAGWNVLASLVFSAFSGLAIGQKPDSEART